MAKVTDYHLRTVYAITCNNCADTVYLEEETSTDACDALNDEGWEVRNGLPLCDWCAKYHEEDD